MHSPVKDKALASNLVMVEIVKEKVNSFKKDGILRDNDIKTPLTNVDVVNVIPNRFQLSTDQSNSLIGDVHTEEVEQACYLKTQWQNLPLFNLLGFQKT